MILGIPTYSRYDLLDRLLASAAAGDEQPSVYVIVDNGGVYTKERVRRFVGDDVEVVYLPMQKNVGVAAAWNVILDAGHGQAIIANDDVVLGRSTFREMAEALREGELFVSVDGWALFGQGQECLERVGYYDENFWPAYYEDVDYAVRLVKAGISIYKISSAGYAHDGWATTRGNSDAPWLRDGRYRNMLYLIAKWGDADWSMVGGAHLYGAPFNGSEPPGWSVRLRGTPMPTRIDILNEIARKIGAKTYLEIGVAGGESIRGVEVAEKWGVDRDLSIADADLRLFKMTSGAFFDLFKQSDALSSPPTFDLVFIDADHHANAVYDDVQGALRHLSQHGIIVIHDCNPHLESLQVVPNPHPGWTWTGDGWKAIARLRSEGHTLRVVDSDYGVGILIPKARSDAFELDVAALTYRDLELKRRALLGLVDRWLWSWWFDHTYVTT